MDSNLLRTNFGARNLPGFRMGDAIITQLCLRRKRLKRMSPSTFPVKWQQR